LPICDPALTDAVEFDDGKLIVGKHATVAQVSYETLVERVGEATWREAWQAARFVAMVNWTMLPYLTELWQKIQVEFPGGERKVMFFDLADPEKRTRSDIREALLTLAKFQEQHDVLMGLNEKEAQHVADVLELEVGNDDDISREQNMIDLASNIREKLGIAVCVVHPTQFAAAANIQTTAVAAGPFTPNPKISTGAGDHFNAGFVPAICWVATWPSRCKWASLRAVTTYATRKAPHANNSPISWTHWRVPAKVRGQLKVAAPCPGKKRATNHWHMLCCA
jgi:hypothetical protein